MDTTLFNLRSNNYSFSIDSSDEQELVEIGIKQSLNDKYDDVFCVLKNLTVDKVTAIIYEGHVFWR